MLLRRHNKNRLMVDNNDVLDNIINNNKVDYSKLGWHELRKLAADKGINTKGKKRKQIENLLKAGDQ